MKCFLYSYLFFYDIARSETGIVWLNIFKCIKLNWFDCQKYKCICMSNEVSFKPCNWQTSISTIHWKECAQKLSSNHANKIPHEYSNESCTWIVSIKSKLEIKFVFFCGAAKKTGMLLKSCMGLLVQFGVFTIWRLCWCFNFSYRRKTFITLTIFNG